MMITIGNNGYHTITAAQYDLDYRHRTISSHTRCVQKRLGLGEQVIIYKKLYETKKQKLLQYEF